MKITKSKKIRRLLLAILFISGQQIYQAQTAPFTINNNTTCRVTLHWQIQDVTNCTGCDWGTVTIPPGSFHTISTFLGTCSSNSTGCEMIITIMSIGTTPIMQTFSNVTPPAPTPIVYPVVPGCTSSTLPNGIYTSPSVFDINP